MKNLTKDQKLEAYKYALKTIEASLENRCMFICNLLESWMNTETWFDEIEFYENEEKYMLCNFPELFKYTPKDYDFGDVMFNEVGVKDKKENDISHSFNNKNRIKALKEIIEKLTKSK